MSASGYAEIRCERIVVRRFGWTGVLPLRQPDPNARVAKELLNLQEK